MKLLVIFQLVLFLNFSSDYETYLKKGDEFHKKFDNINATINYEKAYELSPGNYEVLLKLTSSYNDVGEEYVELRKRDEAQKYIEKAVHYAEIFHKKYPDSADVYCYLAMSYGNLAMYRGSKEKIKLAKVVEENAKKSLKLNPDLYVSLIVLGIYNREVANLGFFERFFANTFFGDVPDGSFEESIAMFNKALKIIPNSIVPSYQLAKTYRYMGEEEKEIELLKRLLNYKIKDFRDKFAISKTKRRLENL